jgi:Cu-Zn family superoxide dismutase
MATAKTENEGPSRQTPASVGTRARGRGRLLALVVVAVALGVACWGETPEVEAEVGALVRVDPGDPGSSPVRRAVATIEPASGSDVHGEVVFEHLDDEPGLEVHARLRGLEPGPHGFHVHVYGDCSAADATSAGTHFNFEGSSLHPPETIDRITGNLGELEAGADGRAEFVGELEAPRLHGPFSLLGRSVVVHARGNDPSEPPIGAAGARVGCGVIGIASPFRD